MHMNEGSEKRSNEQTLGVLAGVTALLFWGCLVLFWRLLEHIPASEVLAWRVISCFFVLLPVVTLTGRWAEVRAALTCRSTLWRMTASTVLIGMNWFTYIWAVQVGRVLETSLGYYMTPLMSVALGLVVLHERLSRLCLAAIFIAAGGVLWALIVYGQFPWVGLALTCTFALYGFIRKTVAVEALPGLFTETALLLPVAVGYILFRTVMGEGFFAHPNLGDAGLLATTGLITAVPLVLFAYSARHVSLTTLGFLQYISPTGTFLIGIFILHEPVTTSTFITFACIWTALVLQSIDSVRKMQQARTKNA